ncbi:MAG: hypothetical protein GWP61_16175 [Chloroflexi bacterium]|jgi:hypothetical protein|nr:hypothetical protein [Chloroflexota bacterium]
MTVVRSDNEWHDPANAQSEHKLALRPILYIGLALVLFLATFFYSFIIPLTPGRLTRPSVALFSELPLWSIIVSLPFPVPQNSWSVAGALIFVTAIAFATYGLAIFVSWNRQAGRRTRAFIFLTSYVFFFLSAFSLPNTSTDIFNYIVNGRIAAVHNSNPYYVTADTFPDDPVYPYASKNYTGLAADKLPAWVLTNVALASLTGDHVTTNLLIYRLALMLFNMANLMLIAIIAYRLNPLFVSTALVIYGWNPIVIVHAQSKSDTLMALLLLLAVLFFVRGHRLIAVGALGLSVMVKLITLPLAAVYMLSNLRLRNWRVLLVDTLTFVFLPLLLFLLFWQGSELTTRLMALFGVAGAAAPGILRLLLVAGFCLLILAVSYFQDGGIKKLLLGWALVMLYFTFFLTKLGLSWYLITLLAIVSLVFDWRVVLVTGALSFTSFFFTAWYGTFTKAFSSPELSSLPTFLVYILLPGLISLGIILLAIGLRKLQLRWSDNATP